jgi:hypothetical protein
VSITITNSEVGTETAQHNVITDFPTSVAVLCKAWVCGHLMAGITSSNPAEGMNVHLLCLLCVVQVVIFATS